MNEGPPEQRNNGATEHLRDMNDGPPEQRSNGATEQRSNGAPSRHE